MAVKSARQANPIGIDLTGDGLLAAQVEILETVPRLVEAVADPEPLGSEEQLRARVGRLMSEYDFVGNRVATSVPSSALSIHHVRLPVLPEPAAADAIAREVGRRLDYDLSDAVLRSLEIASTGGRDGHADHVVFTVPRQVVEQHLRMAEKLGLSVAGISALPLAVGHAFNYLGQRREEAGFTFLLVHLESHVTHLVIVHEGELRFARTIPQGVQTLLEAAAKACGRELVELEAEQTSRVRDLGSHVLLDSRMTQAPSPPDCGKPLPYEQAGPVLDAYVEEIQSCVCYFAGAVSAQGVDKMLFTGPQANDYDVCQLIANRLVLPAQIGDPFAGIQPVAAATGERPGARRPRPEMAVAVGLTLFGAQVN